PVTQLDRGDARPGHPRWGVIYQGRLYICSSDDARRRFLGEPVRYALADVAEQGFCPHCLGESGLLVRGDPQYVVARDGLRYWFPDAPPRPASRAATPRAPQASPGGGATTARR